MKEIWYPTVEKIEEYNFLALTLISVKKKDKPELISFSKLSGVIDEVVTCEGNLYEKAAVLLKGIIVAHAFASGNRRTAFLAAKDFLLNNGIKVDLPDSPAKARIFIGIREGFYSLEEIKDWFKHGKIKEFHR